MNQLHHQLFPQGRNVHCSSWCQRRVGSPYPGGNYVSTGEYISLTKIIHSPYLTFVVLGVWYRLMYFHYLVSSWCSSLGKSLGPLGHWSLREEVHHWRWALKSYSLAPRPVFSLFWLHECLTGHLAFPPWLILFPSRTPIPNLTLFSKVPFYQSTLSKEQKSN